VVVSGRAEQVASFSEEILQNNPHDVFIFTPRDTPADPTHMHQMGKMMEIEKGWKFIVTLRQY